jgi:acetyl-CoA carboxylase biotin carboxyl carrier protein
MAERAGVTLPREGRAGSREVPVDPKEIRELIELISRSSFASFELEGEDFKLKLVKERDAAPAAPQAAPPAVASPTAAAPPSPTPPPAAQAAVEPVQPDGAVPLTSPIVGTFYRSPSPDASPFVEIGSKINKGQVLCIVEAMKVMNEIESEIDAEVIDVLVANGQPVEYGETLFLLRPLS